MLNKNIQLTKETPAKLNFLPSFLKEAYGLLVLLQDWDYSGGGKRCLGVESNIKMFARCLHCSTRFARESIGVLWRLKIVEYREGKFFVK